MKKKLYDFAFEKRLAGHINFLKMSKYAAGHVTKMCDF